ncbi:MAG: hypothetical protein J7J32_04455 [Candidatus Atribacteria bacterium]|nr:hypothetical protein [Candidatus Atribacteria bacterium]MCD6349783.1 hypothetical protein [Candidatus Atribacteria bacterium]
MAKATCLFQQKRENIMSTRTQHFPKELPDNLSGIENSWMQRILQAILSHR